MVYLKTFFLIFSLILGSAFGQNCVGSLSDDLIQAGNPMSKHRDCWHYKPRSQWPIDFGAKSSIVHYSKLGFPNCFMYFSHNYSAFIDFQYNSSQGLDFTLRGGRIGNTNFLGISVLLLQDRRWDRIKVSYLVNSRKDVWLGSFTYSIFLFNLRPL